MKKYKLVFAVLILGIIALGGMVFLPARASAATLTVETADDNTTTDGDCTLREAISNVNDQADTYTDCTGVGAYGTNDTINFTITTGGTTFTNQSQTGYSIQPTSALPTITESVVIDGYTQPNSQENTAVAPNPLNGILLVEIDGSNVLAVANGISIEAENVTIRGLVINNWTNEGIIVNGNNAVIHGNYIGTDPAGEVAQPNANIGVSGWGGTGHGALLGGTTPASRNIISGNGTNPMGSGIGIGNNHNDWQIKGNYIGVAADGVTEIPNAQPGGAGSPSVDYVSGTIIGGLEEGAINVISGNNGIGIAPSEAPNTTIQGNYIGTDYTGTAALGNDNGGVTINYSDDSLIDSNVISNNGVDGIYIADDTSLVASNNTIMSNGTNGIGIEDTSDVVLINNLIQANNNDGISINASSGVDVLGNIISDNDSIGITIQNSSGNAIGGTQASDRNVVSGNAGQANIAVSGLGGLAANNILQGNYIGTDANGNVDSNITQNSGVVISGLANDNVIGGTQAGAGNKIAGNKVAGILITEITIAGNPITPLGNAVLGNSIVYNEQGTTSGTPLPGLGIDILSVLLDGGFNPIGADEAGPTPNDAGDSDTGPNNYMNSPEINTATQNDNELTINLNLDAADSTLGDEYRVEFFANDAVDESGYGEGQTFLGYANITNGANQDATITMTNGTNLTGKVLSATTTALTNDGDGFGSTSEFSQVIDVDVVSFVDLDAEGSTPGTLANTGWNVFALMPLAGALIGTSLYIVIRGRLGYYLGRY